MASFFNLFLGLFILVGLLVAGFGARGAWRDHASQGWPQVPGQVVSSSVEENSSGDGTTYKPRVEYRYSVNGQALVGRRVSFGLDTGTSNEGAAARSVAKYPAGKSVLVRYQAGQPALCVLEAGLTKRSFMGPAFGLGFVLFALWFRLLIWLMA